MQESGVSTQVSVRFEDVEEDGTIRSPSMNLESIERPDGLITFTRARIGWLLEDASSDGAFVLTTRARKPFRSVEAKVNRTQLGQSG